MGEAVEALMASGQTKEAWGGILLWDRNPKGHTHTSVEGGTELDICREVIVIQVPAARWTMGNGTGAARGGGRRHPVGDGNCGGGQRNVGGGGQGTFGNVGG